MFDIGLDYTIEDVNAYWRGFLRKRPGRRGPKEATSRVLRFGGWFFTVGGVLSIIAVPLLMGKLEIPGLMGLLLRTPLEGVLEIFIGVAIFRQGRRPTGRAPYPRWVNRAGKKYQESGKLYSCRFTEDGVWIHGSRSDHRYDCEFLEALWEDADRFYLVLSSKMGAYVLNKGRFREGDPAGLPAYWAERAGKPVGMALP